DKGSVDRWASAIGHPYASGWERRAVLHPLDPFDAGREVAGRVRGDGVVHTGRLRLGFGREQPRRRDLVVEALPVPRLLTVDGHRTPAAPVGADELSLPRAQREPVVRPLHLGEGLPDVEAVRVDR